MSETETTPTAAPGSRKEQAKELIGQAGHALKQEAQSFASAAQDRVRAEAQRGTNVAGKTLGDFANAVRRAGDDLAENDQSPASQLVRRAADGLESLSRNLADKEPGDLLNAVRDFGRRNPAAFIGGAVLLGLAIGRFARASERHELAGLSDEDLTLADTQAFETEPFAAAAGFDEPLADNLGDLASPAESGTTTSLLGEETSEFGTGTSPSPPTGGR